MKPARQGARALSKAFLLVLPLSHRWHAWCPTLTHYHGARRSPCAVNRTSNLGAHDAPWRWPWRPWPRPTTMLLHCSAQQRRQRPQRYRRRAVLALSFGLQDSSSRRLVADARDPLWLGLSPTAPSGVANGPLSSRSARRAGRRGGYAEPYVRRRQPHALAAKNVKRRRKKKRV